MNISVDASQEETFNLAMDYFNEKRMKILDSTPPHYMTVEFGSWTSMSFGNGKGEVEVDVERKDGKSYVNLDFDFSFNYLVYFIIAIVLALIAYVALSSFVNSWALGIGNPLLRSDYLSRANLYVISGALVVFFLGVLFSVIEVSMTRKRFIKEFNMFVQALASKKTEQ